MAESNSTPGHPTLLQQQEKVKLAEHLRSRLQYWKVDVPLAGHSPDHWNVLNYGAEIQSRLDTIPAHPGFARPYGVSAFGISKEEWNYLPDSVLTSSRNYKESIKKMPQQVSCGGAYSESKSATQFVLIIAWPFSVRWFDDFQTTVRTRKSMWGVKRAQVAFGAGLGNKLVRTDASLDCISKAEMHHAVFSLHSQFESDGEINLTLVIRRRKVAQMGGTSVLDVIVYEHDPDDDVGEKPLFVAAPVPSTSSWANVGPVKPVGLDAIIADEQAQLEMQPEPKAQIEKMPAWSRRR